METLKICSSNSKKSIAFLSYSCSGELLAAQCNEPEYELSIWNWKEATIKLQFKKPFFAKVHDMAFSDQNNRFLYTGGVNHLHFWDIVRTFTGLKLLHEYGRFEKFAMCDLLCVYPDDDNRVLTNCDWGNILVWQNARIKFEISRKNRRPCHTKTITQIHLSGENLYTIAMDNFVRIWFWDTVALANLREEDKIIEFEVTYEYEIPSNVKSIDLSYLSFAINDANNQIGYIHDGNGIIWKSVTDKDFTTHQMDIIFRSSSRDLVDVAVSPNCLHLATLDMKGIFCVYDNISGDMIFHHKFAIKSSTMMWCSRKVIFF